MYSSVISIDRKNDNVIETMLSDLKDGKFKSAQKYMNLNIPDSLDEKAKEYLQLLYSKVSILKKETRGEAQVYTIKYPNYSDNLEESKTIEEAIENVKKDKLDYITLPEIEVEVINGRLVANYKLTAAMMLLEVKQRWHQYIYILAQVKPKYYR